MGLPPQPSRETATGCARPRRAGLRLALALLGLVVVASPRHAAGNDEATAAKRPRKAESPAAAEAKPLAPDSTLAEWKLATPAERSRVAVAIARGRLGADAPKLDVATMAMEITGCVSATAKDSRLDEWKVAPAAETCLTAPELPAPGPAR